MRHICCFHMILDQAYLYAELNLRWVVCAGSTVFCLLIAVIDIWQQWTFKFCINQINKISKHGFVKTCISLERRTHKFGLLIWSRVDMHMLWHDIHPADESPYMYCIYNVRFTKKGKKANVYGCSETFAQKGGKFGRSFKKCLGKEVRPWNCIFSWSKSNQLAQALCVWEELTVIYPLQYHTSSKVSPVLCIFHRCWNS